MTYSKPDITEWGEDDPRRSLAGFDRDFLRKQYNDWMPNEKPPVLQCLLSFNKMADIFVPHIAERGGNILDIGCANAELLIALMQHDLVDNGFGIDISDVMIETAKTSSENNEVCLSFECVAIEEYMPTLEYDVVVATEVLEHIFNLRDTLSKIVGWLKDDGLFCGNVPLRKTCDAVVHLHYFTNTSLAKLLDEFFLEVAVTSLDVTGEGEVHLIFVARHPRKGD